MRVCQKMRYVALNPILNSVETGKNELVCFPVEVTADTNDFGTTGNSPSA